jgi:FG-GAP-like repeat/FG-GAP repeat
MWLTSVLDYLKSTSLRTQARRVRREGRSKKPAATRLILEALEERCLLSFSPAVIYPVGAGPRAVVTGDFNGDGLLDLVTANQSSNTVSVLLGKGDGTFQQAQNFDTGAGPQSLAVGDFNGDGKLDLVTVNANDVSVLLGAGNGAFQVPQSLVLPGQFPPGYTGSTALPQAPTSVAVGDLNGDGKLDLAVRGVTAFTVLTGSGYNGNYYTTTYNDGYVNVLLGNGVASFTPKAAYHLDNGDPSALALRDFNGDTRLDVVAVTTSGSGVSVLPGNGDGTLQAPVHSASGVGFNSVVTGDLNGDGKLDLVTRSSDGNGVFVQKGNGDGTFQAPADIPLPGLFLANYSGVEPLPLPQHPEAVVVGDLNGDGKLDLAVTTTSSYSVFTGSGYFGNYYSTVSKGNVNVLLGHGDGTFTDAQIAPLQGGNPYALAAGNFNGDAFPDLAVADPWANSVSVLLNAGDWSTTSPSSFSVSGFPLSTTAGVAGGFTVTAKNADGTTAAGYTGTVHFTSSDGQAVLPAFYTFTAVDGGVHTFSAILETAGTQSITATDTLTLSLTGSETGVTVNPAAASNFDVVAPAGGTAGSAFSVTVTALDPYNNTATGYTGAVHFTSSDGQAILPSDYTFTAADNGVHTFSSGVILKAAGTQTVTASDTVASAITGSAAVTINAAAASTMTVTGFPSPTTAGAAGSLTVTLKDAYGNTASGYTGTVHFTSSDGKAALPANYTFTAADAGVHTFSVILKTAGTQSLTATDTTTGSLTGTDGGITVNPAAASRFVISAPSSVTSGVAFSLTITVEDAYGNVVTGYTGTIHFKSTDRTATLPANYTFTAADKGVHTFTGLVLRKTGKQTLTITDTLNSALTNSVIEDVLAGPTKHK